MNIHLRYTLLSILCAYNLCAHDQAAAGGAFSQDEAQNSIFIQSVTRDSAEASDFCDYLEKNSNVFSQASSTDSIFLPAADVEALESELVQNLLFIPSENVYRLDLSRFFETVDQVATFIAAMREGRYSGEPLDMVKRILMASDFLLISQQKLKTYIQSIAEQEPLLLYRLYKDETMRLGAENWRLIRNQSTALMPFQLHQRLGAVENNNSALWHRGRISSLVKLDDNTVVTGSYDHTAILWHKNTDGMWQLQQRLGIVHNENPALGHIYPISSITKLDDNTVITGSVDTTAIVWHKNTDGLWQLQQRLGVARNRNAAIGHTHVIDLIAKLDDDTVITGSTDHTTILWHKNSDGVWQLQQRLGIAFNNNPAIGHTRYINSIIKLDDDTLITGSFDNTAILWHKKTDGLWQLQGRLGVARNRNAAIGHTEAITSIAKLDYNTVITGSFDNTAIVWHKNTDGMWQLQQRLGIVHNENPALGHIYPISSIAKLDDDTVITGSFDNTAIVWHRSIERHFEPMLHAQQPLEPMLQLQPAVSTLKSSDASSRCNVM